MFTDWGVRKSFSELVSWAFLSDESSKLDCFFLSVPSLLNLYKMFRFFPKSWTYSALPTAEKSESDVSAPFLSPSVETTEGAPCQSCTHRAKRCRQERIGGILLLIFSSVVMFALGNLVFSSQPSIESQVTKRISSYSPLLKDYNRILREIRFNGTLEWPSPYRGPPAPEIDKAWNRVTMVRPLNFSLTDDEYLRVGKDPKTAARNLPEYGGGYFLVPEFTHQLHCVNLLRKVSHFKFGYYNAFDPDFTDNTDIFKVHIGKSQIHPVLRPSKLKTILDHCVEQLRQFVMCHADMGVVTAHWIQQRHKPWPDFNTNHMCRDFDQVMDWTKQHLTPVGTPFIPRKPDGAPSLSSPP